MKSIIKLEDALRLSYQKNLENHKKYGNSGFVSYLGLLDFYKRYTGARGSSLWDENGNEYLDFLAGYGSLNVGHNHPKVLDALKKAKDLPNLMQASLNPLAGALAHNLALLTPGNLQRSFFCNSGAEAVEAAIKLAKIATGREKILYCNSSFHGKTLGSLSVTGRKKYQDPFNPLLSWCEITTFGDLEMLEGILKERNTAAFIIEPIQGEGGINVPPEGYLKQVQEICRRYGTLLILDEIQTGMGRTGYMFACEHENVVPDILCLAKSLGGGVMPVGAIVTNDNHWQKAYGSVEKCLIHTTTFGGNSMAMAAALATLEVMEEENLVSQARDKGEYLLNKLKELGRNYHLIKVVRGRGLLIGLEVNPVESAVDKFAGGVLGSLSSNYTGAMIAGELINRYKIITAYTLNNPNVIRFEPPLNITYQQIDYCLESLQKIFARNKGFLSLAFKSSRSVFKSFTRRSN